MLKILHWRTHAKWLCASSRTGCRGAEVCLELISLLLLSEIVYFILYARAVDAHRKIQYIVGRAEPHALEQGVSTMFFDFYARTDTLN